MVLYCSMCYQPDAEWRGLGIHSKLFVVLVEADTYLTLPRFRISISFYLTFYFGPYSNLTTN